MMKRPIYIKTPASQQDRSQEIFRRLVQILLALSLFGAFFAGTFPFDFAIPPGGFINTLSRRWDWAWNPYDPGHVDRIENLLFLMPLGFSVAGAASLARRKISDGLTIAIGLLIAGVVSTSIECSQALVSFRDPSFADVWCNAVGGGIGTAVFVFAGRRVLKITASQLNRYQRLFTLRNRVILLCVYALAQLVFPLMLHGSGELDLWNLSMPLIVGNEINSEHRGWSGVVANVALADRAATPEQIHAIAHGTRAMEALGTSVLADYVLAGPGPYPDLSGHEKPLRWAGSTPGISTDQGVTTSQEEWLKTDGPIFNAIKHVQQTSEFTFCTQAATLNTTQQFIPPLRIATISNGTSERNVTLGQDGSDLVVRVRTAVAFMPDLYLRDVLSDTYSHALAVTAKAGSVIVYVDGLERGRCEITPEAKIIWRLYPRGAFRMYIDQYGDRSYAVMYRLLVMLPFALLLAMTIQRWPRPTRRKRLVTLAAVASMTILLEAVIWFQGGHPPSMINALVSFAIGAIALIGTLREKTRVN